MAAPTDPRQLLAEFYGDGDTRGPRGALRVRGLAQDPALGETKWFAVYRPCSAAAIEKMTSGVATGKYLNVKGESATGGAFAGFVPFAAISDNEHKAMIEKSPSDARLKVYYRNQSLREDAWTALMSAMEDLGSSVDIAERKIERVDDYEPDVFGLDLPEPLLREVYLMKADLSAAGGETGLASKPAYMNMNLQSIRNVMVPPMEGSDETPKVVLFQHDEENALNPHGLLMAYAEKSVRPVVPDFDTLLVGSKGMPYEPLPAEQADMLSWCLDKTTQILEAPDGKPWTQRWLQVLQSESPQAKIPAYGFGDPTSYGLIKDAVAATSSHGAVRHGAECFNFFFPQEFDQEYLVVWNEFAGEPWQYISAEQLRAFLLDRIRAGFVFPLNPVWPARDAGWMEVLKAMSNDKISQNAMAAWFPPSTGAIDRMLTIGRS